MLFGGGPGKSNTILISFLHKHTQTHTLTHAHTHARGSWKRRMTRFLLLVHGRPQVSLLNYPSVVQHAPALRYPGHSSHVTGVRWARDESYAISVGGRDRWGSETSLWKVFRLRTMHYCLPGTWWLKNSGPAKDRKRNAVIQSWGVCSCSMPVLHVISCLYSTHNWQVSVPSLAFVGVCGWRGL